MKSARSATACEARRRGTKLVDGDRDAGYPPRALASSFSEQSKNGPHHYWLLEPGEPVSLFAAAQRPSPASCGCRAFLHQKDEPFLVQLIEVNLARRCTIRETLLHHEAVGESPPPRQGSRGAAPRGRPSSGASFDRRCCCKSGRSRPNPPFSSRSAGTTPFGVY